MLWNNSSWSKLPLTDLPRQHTLLFLLPIRTFLFGWCSLSLFLSFPWWFCPLPLSQQPFIWSWHQHFHLYLGRAWNNNMTDLSIWNPCMETGINCLRSMLKGNVTHLLKREHWRLERGEYLSTGISNRWELIYLFLYTKLILGKRQEFFYVYTFINLSDDTFYKLSIML